VDSWEVDKPQNALRFPYKRPNQYVTSDNISNIFRQYLTRMVKAKEISIEDYRVLSDKIRKFKELAGDKVEALSTLLNKPETSKIVSEIIYDLGFDALEISENGIVTYGLLKRKKDLSFKAGFDPNQSRNDDGTWGSGGPTKEPEHFLGYHSSKYEIDEISKGEILDSSVYQELIRTTYIDYGGPYLEDVEDMADWFESEGYSFTFVSSDIIEGSAFQASKYKYGDYLYKVYGNGWPHDIKINDPNEIGATIIMSKKPLIFKLQNEQKAGFKPTQRRDKNGRWTDKWGSMRSKEQEIKDQQKETALIYDENGNLLGEYYGTETHVDIPMPPLSSYVLTHNHNNTKYTDEELKERMKNFAKFNSGRAKSKNKK